MFELPDARRVRREDLHSHSSRSSSPSTTSSSWDTDTRATTLARLEQTQHLSLEPAPPTLPISNRSQSPPPPTSSTSQTNPPPTETEPQPETYAFKLFAPSKPSSTNTHAPLTSEKLAHITLSDPTIPTSPGFTAPRPNASPYYKPTASHLSNLKASVLDYVTIRKLSQQAWPGCCVPWRVIHLSLPAKLQRRNQSHLSTLLQPADSAEQDKRRCRKSKKTRIKRRVRLRAEETKKKEAEEKKANEGEEKERRERVKRVKANRRRLEKRREKAKEAKGVEVERVERG